MEFDKKNCGSSMLPINRESPDNFGLTAIHYATIHGHTEIVKILAPFTPIPLRNLYL